MFLNICENIRAWFYSLPEYCATAKKQYLGKGQYININEEILNFKESLRGTAKNPYFYINSCLHDIFECDTFNKIKKAKIFTDQMIESLKLTLINDINFIFPETLYGWYKSLPDCATKRIYKNNEESFFKFCSQDSFDINKLCKYLTGLSIENWNEETPLTFYEELIKIRKAVESIKDNKINEGFMIKYLDKSGKTIEKMFDTTQIENYEVLQILNSDLKSVFNDYGTSLSYLSKIGAVLKLAFEEVSF